MMIAIAIEVFCSASATKRYSTVLCDSLLDTGDAWLQILGGVSWQLPDLFLNEYIGGVTYSWRKKGIGRKPVGREEHSWRVHAGDVLVSRSHDVSASNSSNRLDTLFETIFVIITSSNTHLIR